MIDPHALWNTYDLYGHLEPIRRKVTEYLHLATPLPPLLTDFTRADPAALERIHDLLLGASAAWYEGVVDKTRDADNRRLLPPEQAEVIRREVMRLRIRAEAQRIHDIEQAGTVDAVDQTVPGSALLDQPAGIPAIWGHGDEVLWAEGEPFLLVAPPGVGKTTLMGQVVAGIIGSPSHRHVLGWPVQQRRRVLYLAADRPKQIMRSLRRHLAELDRDDLDDRLVIWKGPPPADLAKQQDALLNLCRAHRADVVILDSLKDMAVGIVDDVVGSGLNRAIQLTVAAGIEVGALHHQRKGQGGAKPKTLEDVYGSTWITAGAGSVVLLWGAAGEPLVELYHLKQPADSVGPLKVEHDHTAGRSTVYRGFDPLAYLRNRKSTGTTSTEMAKAWFEKSTPTPAERMKALRKLDGLVAAGLAERASLATEGGNEGSRGAVYVATNCDPGATHGATNTALPDGDTHGAHTPRTPPDIDPGQATNGATHATNTAGHARTPPLLVGGLRVAEPDPLDAWDPLEGIRR